MRQTENNAAFFEVPATAIWTVSLNMLVYEAYANISEILPNDLIRQIPTTL